MTWYYNITNGGADMDVIDHTGAVVATVSNNGGGFDIPGDVLAVMHDEGAARNWDYNTEYVQQLLKDAAFERIEEQ